MSLVIDASVAVKWVVLEPGHVEAVALVKGRSLIAPDIVLVETANVLWRKVRMGTLETRQALEGLEFIGQAFERIVPATDLVARALQLALELDHPVYDCLYLACAEPDRLEILTADERLVTKIGSSSSHRLVRLAPGATS